MSTETQPTCSCPNQFLLPDGAKCEICGGFVQGVQSIASTSAQEAIWDEFYFEELETFYEDIEYTA